VLVYAFVEFLKVAGNRGKLRKCPRCGAAFIAAPGRAGGMECGRCRGKKAAGIR